MTNLKSHVTIMHVYCSRDSKWDEVQPEFAVFLCVFAEAITSIMIRNYTTPINEKNFSLTCEVVGPYDIIYWMKNGEYLNVSDSCGSQQAMHCTEKNMLHFTPVTLKDDGKYQCVASNRGAVHMSPEYTPLINCESYRKLISFKFIKNN